MTKMDCRLCQIPEDDDFVFGGTASFILLVAPDLTGQIFLVEGINRGNFIFIKFHCFVRFLSTEFQSREGSKKVRRICVRFRCGQAKAEESMNVSKRNHPLVLLAGRTDGQASNSARVNVKEQNETTTNDTEGQKEGQKESRK